MQGIAFWLAALFASVSVLAGEVLLVADEFPAMNLLANRIQTEENLQAKIVPQSRLPSDLSPFPAVVVYIHMDLAATVEQALIRYTRDGGKLVVLHHSISSGKRKNKDWFDFLGVALPAGGVEQGGYQWIEGVSLEVVRLDPGHFITTNRVNYPEAVSWTASDGGSGSRVLPGFRLEDSEVYLNHVLSGSHTLLLGFRYVDAKSGKAYLQSHAGWLRASGKGWIVYLMPGHSGRDFDQPSYGRIVANALVWKP
jgi:hypothetical protein